MKKLLLFTITLVFMLTAQAKAADTNTVKATIVKHAIELGVDPAIALSLAKTESGFKHETKSGNGAVGVFQLMPSTARRMGFNPYLLNDNIKAGIMYYKMMYKMFGSMELALAAYNAGPGNVKKFKAVPPYAETKRFVKTTMADYHKYKANPDPAMVKAVNKQKAVTATPAKVSTMPSIKENPVSSEKAVDTNSAKGKVVVDETPKNLEIEATALAM